MTSEEIKSLLSNLAVAWGSKEAGKVASLFCEDGIYRASMNASMHGEAMGRPAIRKRVQGMFREDDGSVASTTNLIIDGQVAAWRWRYTFANGEFVEGCDFFEFRDGLIALKDAYRRIHSDAQRTKRQAGNLQAEQTMRLLNHQSISQA